MTSLWGEAAMESEKVGAARPPSPEQKQNSLLRELVTCFSQPRNLVVALLAEMFSTTVGCTALLRHGVSNGCEADPKGFHVAKEAAIRHFAEAAHDAETDIELHGEAAKAAVKVASLVPEMAVPSLLRFSPEGLLLYQCTTRVLHSFL